MWHYEGQISYYLRGNEARLQLAYSRFQFQDKNAGNELILAAQVSY